MTDLAVTYGASQLMTRPVIGQRLLDHQSVTVTLHVRASPPPKAHMAGCMLMQSHAEDGMQVLTWWLCTDSAAGLWGTSSQRLPESGPSESSPQHPSGQPAHSWL